MSNQLTEILENSGLEIATQESIQKGLGPFFESFDEIADEAKNIIVVSEDQKDLMKEASTMRKKFVKMRTKSGEIKKALKKDSITYGSTVMSVYNLIVGKIEAVEMHLHKQEKFAEIKEAARVTKLAEERRELAKDLSKWIPVDVTFGKLTEEEFNRVLTGAKLTKEHEEKEALKAAEEERQAKLEQELLRAENARIKAENDKLQAEKKAVEDKIYRQDEAEESLNDEIVNEANIEESILLDRAKYLRWVIVNEMPRSLKDPALNKTLQNAKLLIEKTARYIEENATNTES